MRLTDRTKKNIMCQYGENAFLGGNIRERMLRDPQIKACINIKKKMTLRGRQEIHPYSDSAEDREVCDFVRKAIYSAENTVTSLLENVLDAFTDGFSLNETVYRRGGEGKIVIDSFRKIDPSDAEFRFDRWGDIEDIYVGGVRCPREKLILYTYGSSYPYGSSDLVSARGHFEVKEKIKEFYNVYLEKYASPLVKGVYKKGFSQENQRAFFDVLKSIRQKTALIVPEDCQVENMNLNNGGGDCFQKAIDYHDRQIAKAILGQTIFTDENVTVGSYSLAKVHLDLLGDCLSAIRRDMEETVMNEQVIKPLADLNFGTGRYPRFAISDTDGEMLKKNSEALADIINLGIADPKEYWIRDFLGIPENKED